MLAKGNGIAPLHEQGFTLLEVLVALTILAVALAAALRATGIAADQTESLRDRLGATWVAQNRMALHRAMKDWPSPGTYDGDAEQGGLRFAWQEVISNTSNPAFRRVAVRVYAPQTPDEVLASLTGYLVREPDVQGAPPQAGSQESGAPGTQESVTPDAGTSDTGSGQPSPQDLRMQELRAQEPRGY